MSVHWYVLFACADAELSNPNKFYVGIFLLFSENKITLAATPVKFQTKFRVVFGSSAEIQRKNKVW